MTGKYVLSELGSPGKSGSFFYYSQDYRFIIKTIHFQEHKFLRKILRYYYDHVKQNPNTLLARFYGLHRVKLPKGRKIHFVVMGNVFPPNKDIHETYDLKVSFLFLTLCITNCLGKGSVIGRGVSDETIVENPNIVLKDLDWVRFQRKILLGTDKRTVFVDQLERDVSLLQSLNIMDYSLLLGIHYKARGNRENLRDKNLSMFEVLSASREITLDC